MCLGDVWKLIDRFSSILEYVWQSFGRLLRECWYMFGCFLEDVWDDVWEMFGRCLGGLGDAFSEMCFFVFLFLVFIFSMCWPVN